MIKITVIVPIDKTDFKKVEEELKAAGMTIDEIHSSLGVIHGSVQKNDNECPIKALAKLDSVNFVTTRN